MQNLIVVTGRFTKKPELQKTKNGKIYASFCLANQENYAKQEHVNFIYCMAWGRLAETICTYLDKGSLVNVEGSLRTETIQDNVHGSKYIAQINCSRVHFLDRKKDEKEKTIKAQESLSSKTANDETNELLQTLIHSGVIDADETGPQVDFLNGIEDADLPF